jgi:hypothetical protein
MVNIFSIFYNKYYNLFIICFILFLGLLTFTIDITLSDGKKCLQQIDNKKDKARYIGYILVHHIYFYIINLGWLFNDIRIVIFFGLMLLVTIIQWNVLGICILTIDTAKVCKNDESHNFNDILKMTKIKSEGKNYILYIIAFCIVFIYTYRIYNIYSLKN